MCLLSPKISSSLPTQDMNLPLPITPALHRLDPEILFLEVGDQKEAADTFEQEQPQTRQKRKIRVRTKIPLSSEVVR